MPDDGSKNIDKANDAILEAIKGIDTKVNNQMENFGDIESQIESMKKSERDRDKTVSNPPKDKKPEFSWMEDIAPDADSETFTKKEINEKISESHEAAKKVAAEAAEKVYETKNERRNRDREAMDDFPLLDKKSRQFDQKFYDAVGHEIDSRVSRGRSNDADIVYDAAAYVEKRWTDEGRYIPKSRAEREVQELNNRQDNFSVKGKPTESPDKPNAKQIDIAKKMGMNKETLTKRFAKMKEL